MKTQTALLLSFIACSFGCSDSDFKSGIGKTTEEPAEEATPPADGEITAGEETESISVEDENGVIIAGAETEFIDQLMIEGESLEINCKATKTLVIPWKKTTSDANYTTYKATYSYDEIKEFSENWMYLQITIDGAPSNPGTAKIGEVEFTNPADGTYCGDDTFLKVFRTGKWSKLVHYPCATTTVKTGEIEKLPPVVEFLASVSKLVTVQDAQIVMGYCEQLNE